MPNQIDCIEHTDYSIFESISDSIFVVDIAGTVLYWNQMQHPILREEIFPGEAIDQFFHTQWQMDTGYFFSIGHERDRLLGGFPIRYWYFPVSE